MFELPVEATKLAVRTLTVNSHCLAHGIAAREAVAFRCRRYGWSVIAVGAVIVLHTRILVCCTFAATGNRGAACASGGASSARADGTHRPWCPESRRWNSGTKSRRCAA